MHDLVGRTAVVTGAASGIGFALASAFVREGTRVVLADVEVNALEQATSALAREGGEVLAVPTDVSDAEQVERLRERTEAVFGPTHVLCNNAGVLLPQQPAWELGLDDWRWVVDVNLWGVVNGIRTFVPGMVASGQPGHVVNTSSNAGVVTVAGQAAYSASKHAVTAMSETLELDLRAAGADIGVTVLCPGPVRTSIARSARNRPDGRLDGDRELDRQGVPQVLERVGDDPDDVARAVVRAIRQRTFYVFTRPSVHVSITDRARRMVDGDAPAVPAHLAAYGLGAPEQ